MKYRFMLVSLLCAMAVLLSGCVLEYASEMGERQSELVRNNIYDYFEYNKSRLTKAIDVLDSFPSQTEIIRKNDETGKICAEIKWEDYVYEIVPVNQSEILSLFENDSDMEIIFDEDEVICFEFWMIENEESVGHQGFYYSPSGMPKWVRLKEKDKEKYFDGSFNSVGNGMEADLSCVSDQDREDSMRSYSLYTERITDNFFYYKKLP